eukprot:622009-Pleurochrysis_carterae.AAC.4
MGMWDRSEIPRGCHRSCCFRSIGAGKLMTCSSKMLEGLVKVSVHATDPTGLLLAGAHPCPFKHDAPVMPPSRSIDVMTTVELLAHRQFALLASCRRVASLPVAPWPATARRRRRCAWRASRRVHALGRQLQPELRRRRGGAWAPLHGDAQPRRRAIRADRWCARL